jgi:hypothetical protein
MTTSLNSGANSNISIEGRAGKGGLTNMHHNNKLAINGDIKSP